MTDNSSSRKSLRLWPGVLIVALQWFGIHLLPVIAPDAQIVGMLGGLATFPILLIWWMFLSRAPWSDRLAALGVMVVGLVVAPMFADVSIASGAMGMMFYMLCLPWLSLALVAWAGTTQGLADQPRRLAMAALLLLACGAFALVKTGGMSGGNFNVSWRWAPTAEEELLATADPLPPAAPVIEEPEPAAIEVEPAEEPAEPETEAPAREAAVPPRKPAEWPGFRGPTRDGVVQGLRIETDWSSSPPVEIWKRAVGPGWSSFAVGGDHLYTQEQRGEEELVSCYDLNTGEPVWVRRDPARFWESMGGAGPRATPALADGRVYALGATGILNALDADTGAEVWSRDVGEDTGAPLPTWGFAGSPLLVDDMVVVVASTSWAAYDRSTGELRWSSFNEGEAYSSPRLMTIAGDSQLIAFNREGVNGIAPADGSLLWSYEWKGNPILQASQTADGDLLIVTGQTSGTRRVSVSRNGQTWNAEQRWHSNSLKPYFNGIVVHKGHAYGVDGRILAAIELESGERKWKGGRYGQGQMVVLAEQDLLLVLTELGELALVSATPDAFNELARIPAIDGGTWNHPAIAGDVLLVRNSKEMAAFRLPISASETQSD